MKLLFIYGPPAVGKLTVAEELAALTGFKVFHNHLTIDLVYSIFERGTASFPKIVWLIRLAILAEAAQVNLNGLIFTMVYAKNRQFRVRQCIEAVEPHGGEVCFVHLHCKPETLKKRVLAESRKKHGKITTVELLNEFLDTLQAPFGTVSDRESLSINTDEVEPHEAAQKIVTHYNLPRYDP